MMAILLAEMLITLGASLQRWCQLQKAGVLATDANILEPAVVPVVAIGVIKSFPYSYCQWIGVDTSQGIQQPSVPFWGNGSGVIPCLQEAPKLLLIITSQQHRNIGPCKQAGTYST
jgi:hypothetical protein